MTDQATVNPSATLTATPPNFPPGTRAYRYDDHGGTGGGITWPDGPWMAEPDKIVWADTVTELDCMMVRNWHGAWCGYVGVPEGHPFFEKPYAATYLDTEDYSDELRVPGVEEDVEVHGSLTFAGRCQPGAVEAGRHICHTARAGYPEVWWFGFDCSHYNDVSPGMSDMGIPFQGQTYRTVGYVQGEVIRLAAQLKAAA